MHATATATILISIGAIALIAVVGIVVGCAVCTKRRKKGDGVGGSGTSFAPSTLVETLEDVEGGGVRRVMRARRWWDDELEAEKVESGGVKVVQLGIEYEVVEEWR